MLIFAPSRRLSALKTRDQLLELLEIGRGAELRVVLERLRAFGLIKHLVEQKVDRLHALLQNLVLNHHLDSLFDLKRLG